MNKNRRNIKEQPLNLRLYICVGIIIWLLFMLLGFAWIMQGTKLGHVSDNTKNNNQKQPEVNAADTNFLRNQVSKSEISKQVNNGLDHASSEVLRNDRNSSVNIINSNSFNLQVRPVPLRVVSAVFTATTPQPSGQILSIHNLELRTGVSATTEPTQHIIKPKKKLTFEAIWSMDAAHQREALQNMYDLEPPSNKAANDFIALSESAIARGVLDGEPPLWPFPGSGKGQPGDMLKYTIANKEVTIPYGYPDESIFILTVSYKDPEVASTIARAFARAAHPDRVFVGIHVQNEGGEVQPERDPIAGLAHAGVKCPQHPVCTRLRNIRVSRQHFKLSEGPTVARARAERFYRNETYALGIDSHCHFIRGWDNIAIDMFKRIGNDHAIITTYPISYDEGLQGGDGSEPYDPELKPAVVTSICQTRRVNIHTTISFKHNFNSLPATLLNNGPVRVAWFAAGFSFSRGHRILRVPYDFYTPYIFDGEETSMGVRAWTWGYDLYQPDRTIISHLYISSGSSVRPVFWDTPDWGVQWPCQYSSLLRLQKELHIFDILQKPVPGGPESGPGGLKREGRLDMSEFDRYEVGPRRDANDFWKWAQVDLQNNWGAECKQPPDERGHIKGPPKKGRQYCYSGNLCSLYSSGQGMPYVPWKPGTEDLFPPLVRSARYPPEA